MPCQPSEMRHPSEFFCIEFCSGSGGLTAALRAHGFRQSFGVDNASLKRPKAPILQVDLSTPACRPLLSRWLASPSLCYIHVGPPCGTAARARERRMSRTAHGPPPLRSAIFPDGLPDLSGFDKARVVRANALYATTAWLAVEAHSRDVLLRDVLFTAIFGPLLRGLTHPTTSAPLSPALTSKIVLLAVVVPSGFVSSAISHSSRLSANCATARMHTFLGS